MKKELKKSGIPLSEKLGYGVGAIGLDMSYGLCFSFFIKYSTDVLGVAAGFIGIITAIARIWDGINDPMMGMIVSNTKSKYGRFRPWILTGAVLNAVILFFMFTKPFYSFYVGGVDIALYIHVALMYILWGMSYTIIDIPYWSFVPALTTDPQERNVIASFPRFFSGVGQLTVMGATSLILAAFSSDEQDTAYSLIAGGIGVMFIILALITFLKTRERIIPEHKTAYKFRDIIKTIRSNDQALVFVAVAVTFNLSWYLMNGLAAYYFDYIAENGKLLTIFAAVTGAGQAIGLFGVSAFSGRIGKHNVIKVGMSVSIVAYLLLFITNIVFGFSPVLFFILAFIAGLGIGNVFTAEASMLADIVDYGEYRTGERADAIIFSMKSFQMKFAQTIQALIIGFGLEICRYQENVVPQPVGAKNGIMIMMFAIPFATALVSLIIFNKKYIIHSELLEKITLKMQDK
ncbi:MAG: MFS transporter [Clostridia bacterium]|nr:MFS transporter [Clostridia bacterium]